MGHFDFLNMAFFTKAAIYPGSVGTFRYRFKRDGWTDGGGYAHSLGIRKHQL